MAEECGLLDLYLRAYQLTSGVALDARHRRGHPVAVMGTVDRDDREPGRGEPAPHPQVVLSWSRAGSSDTPSTRRHR